MAAIINYKHSSAPSLKFVLDITESSNIPINKTLFAFDWDLTLKVYNRISQDMFVRGREESVHVLHHLKQEGGRLAVVTARDPSPLVWETVDIELKALDLAELFDDCVKGEKRGCIPMKTASDTQMYVGHGIIVSGYEKAEALDMYCRSQDIEPEHLVFVDDFVVNSFNVGAYFGQEEKSGLFKRVTSVWWDPVALVPHDLPSLPSSENSYSDYLTEYRKIFGVD
ncbi:hypothetical protein Bbelb_129110 [Branchiostoma belcheri]|nr:hypothetical protein Bbelb_129110 [Branchiostoma belcheri]